jgi:LCP family protein required for cell wall assembly
MGDGVSKSEQVTQQQATLEGDNPPSLEVSPEVSPENLTTSVEPSPPKSPELGWSRWVLRGFLVGLTASVSAAIGAVLILAAPLPINNQSAAQQPLSLQNLWRKSFRYQITRPVNVLVMGIDLPLNLPDDRPSAADSHPSKAVFAGRSDTMLLVRIDPDQETANLLSIPRDTQVYIPGEGVEKINYANSAGGSKLAGQVVSSTLNGVTIDRYIRVSTGAFRELVDLLGGVRVFVPERMQYEDVTQKLKIDLQPGWQTLNGNQAEQFARFRDDGNGDIGRVQRQQQLIRALREKMASPALLPRIPQAIQLFQKYIDTNLSFEEMLSLADFGLGLEQNNFHMVMLPGRFSMPDEFVASYWLMDQNGKDQVMQEYFDVGAGALTHSQTSQTDLRIAIQNASDDPHLGNKMAAYLQSKGFNNTYLIQDWADHEAKTQIIAQTGDLQSASALETVLGVGQVVSASTGDLQSDLTIRVGNDWAKQSGI